MDKRIFYVTDETGQKKQADLLTVLNIKLRNKNYAIYAIPDSGDTDSIICASEVIKSENGQDILSDISSLEEKNEILNIVKNMILHGEQND